MKSPTSSSTSPNRKTAAEPGPGEAAFRHLGYVIAPVPGSDVYDVLPPRGEVSAHEVIRALARFAELD